jgi:hypothetical protein
VDVAETEMSRSKSTTIEAVVLFVVTNYLRANLQELRPTNVGYLTAIHLFPGKWRRNAKNRNAGRFSEIVENRSTNQQIVPVQTQNGQIC